MGATEFQQIFTATLHGAERSLQHMPDGAYRRYCSGILSEGGARRDAWLQLMGVTGLIRLTVGLLDGLVHRDEWARLADYVAVINIQQMYEVVSDNLAIGLVHPKEGDDTFALRRALLGAFNRSMIDRLGGSPQAAPQLLAPVEPLMRRISTFAQSLSPDKHRALAEHASEPREELEYALWPSLIANIETTYDLAQTTGSCRIGDIVKQGLISRYAGVDSLLKDPKLPFAQRLRASTGAIMVIPTLAYYVAVLAEIVRPMANLPQVIDQGLLRDAFYDAAILVRLLNDIGPRILAQTPQERQDLMSSLRARAARSSARTLDVLLRESLEEWAPLFTRIRKDILHREFNLCVHDYSTHVTDALDLFEEELACATQEYQQAQARLASSTRAIDEQLGEVSVGCLIRRFVGFHEALYRRDYDDNLGEYAV